jgi:hypothetical protein
MARLSFDQQVLRARLDRLDSRSRAEFALDCAERLMAHYQRVHDQTGKGNPAVLKDALTTGRAHLSIGEKSAAELRLLANQCEALVPVEDDSWTNLSGLAQNAAAGAAYALRCIASESTDDATWAAVQAYEAADLVASSRLDVDFNEPGAEDLIVAEDAVQLELITQDELLRSLEQSGPR